MIAISLRLPFGGDFPISFPFGREATDPTMAEKFQTWGIIGHHGVDIALPEGTPVLSCADGSVIQSGENGDWGISVTIKHPWGISIYGHLKETIVSDGQELVQGTIIGYSGATGAAFGPHLHFGIKPTDSDEANGYLGFIDPAPYLSAATVEAAPTIGESPQPTEVTPPSSPPPSRREIPVGELIDEILHKRLTELRSKANQARQKKREKLLEEIVTLAEGQPVTNAILREYLRISRQTATNYLRLLANGGRLRKLRQGRATRYEKM